MPSADPLDDPKDKPATAKPLKPFSISLSKGKTQPAAAKSLNSRKRPHSSLAEDDSEIEDISSKAQPVSAFDHSAGGAISVNGHEKGKGPLVIPGQKNRDWREESYRRKGKSLLPPEVQAVRSGGGREDVTLEKHEAPPSFGLIVAKAADKNTNGDSFMADVGGAGNTALHSEEAPNEDDEAIHALLSNGAKNSTLILPIASDDSGRRDVWTQRENEDDAFRSDLASRPDPASLADYAAVPVDEFGPAMMRGMGWKGPQAAGDQFEKAVRPKELVRRPALLGIGAKETPDGVEELGAWGKAAKGKRKVQKSYNPVLLKNSVTGETITEEELEKRKKGQVVDKQEWRERRDEKPGLDTEKKGQKLFEGVDKVRGNSRLSRERSQSPDQVRYHSFKRKRYGSDEQDGRTIYQRDRSGSVGRRQHNSSRRDRSESPHRRHHSSSRRYRSHSRDRKRSNGNDHDGFYNDDHNRKDKQSRKHSREKYEGGRKYHSSSTRIRDQKRASNDG